MSHSGEGITLRAPRYVWIGVIGFITLALIVVVVAVVFGKDSGSGAITVSEAWVRATVPQQTTTPADSGMGDTSGAMSGDTASQGSSGMEMSGDATAGARVTGAFMLISNTTSQDDRLIQAAVSADITDTVEIHQTTIDENDVMRMRPVDGIVIPANGSAELKPGGYHIMLLNVQRDLNPGDTVSLTLTFESGKKITVEAPVRALE